MKLKQLNIQKIKQSIKGLFSLDELKFSSIMFIFLIFTSLAIWQFITTKEINNNLVGLIEFFAGAVVTYNGVKTVFGGTQSTDATPPQD